MGDLRTRRGFLGLVATAWLPGGALARDRHAEPGHTGPGHAERGHASPRPHAAAQHEARARAAPAPRHLAAAGGRHDARYAQNHTQHHAPHPAEATAAAPTQLRLALPAGQSWRLSALAAPPRLVLDLPGLSRVRLSRSGPAATIRGARFVDSRVVVQLAGPVALHGARLTGRELVVEFAPGPAANFEALADGRALASSATASGNLSPAVARISPPPQAANNGPNGGGPLPLVVLDPGHGGRDPGAIGARGTQEKRITLAVAQALARELERGGRCRVLLTRRTDVFIPLEERTAIARRHGAALFVSLHADSAPDPVRGASVYTLADTASDRLAASLARRENQADRAGGMRFASVPPEVAGILASLVRQETRAGSERLARLAVAELGRDVTLLPNSRRHAGFMVLKSPDTPSMLVEMGFLSHPADEAALNRAAHRGLLATSLARAIEAWLLRQQQTAARGGLG